MSNSFPYRIPLLSAALSLKFRFCFPRWLIIPARFILWHLQGLFWKSVLSACVWLVPWVSVKKTAHILWLRKVTRDVDRPPWNWYSTRSHHLFVHLFLPSFFHWLIQSIISLSITVGVWNAASLPLQCSLHYPCFSFEEQMHRVPDVGLNSKLLHNYGASLWSVKFTI